MSNYVDLFAKTGDPANETRLDEIEHALGRQLPDDYRALIRETGGGTLKLAKCVMPGLPGEAEGLATEDVFGNGTNEDTRTFDLATYATFLMEEWEIPDEVLLFATTEDGMHNCFVINYDLPDHPAGAVLDLDTNPGGAMTRVADSVTDFLSKLEPYSGEDAEEYHPSAGQEGMGIKGVWHGGLSDDLTRAIAATPTPDLEYLLRKAAVPLTRSFSPGMTYNSPEGRRFQDLLYWAAQHIQPHPDTWSYLAESEQLLEPNLPTLLGAPTFMVVGQRYSFVWNRAAIELWWERRVNEGVLKETPDGYVLDEDFITGVLEEMREEEK